MPSFTEKLHSLAMKKSAPLKPTFLGIPSEVKLSVLESLDPKTIQRARRVSSDFRDLIDKHKTSLAKPAIVAEVCRLQGFLDHHNYRGLPLADALVRWLALRGLTEDTYYEYDTTYCFVLHYLHDQPKSSAFSRITHASVVRTMVRLLFMEHLASHPEFERRSTCPRFKTAEGFMGLYRGLTRDVFSPEVANSAFGLDDEVVREIYHENAATLDASPHPKLHKTIPSIYADTGSLITTRGCEPKFLEKSEIHLEGLCSSDQFSKLFGVPQLLETMVFAYYSTDKWTNDQVHRAIEDGSGFVDPLIRAAVLQGLVIR